jgi:serine/threonine-protein kinase
MAEIWAARVPGADPHALFAMKIVHPRLVRRAEFVRMFFEEAELAKSIRHPNVVDVYDADCRDGLVFMIMEWIEGESLHCLIAEAGKRRPVPAELAVRIIADTAAGLHAAHELRTPRGRLVGVVHRDVSPQNILIRIDGSVKLVDFGVANVMSSFEQRAGARELKGKLGYMSPEQASCLPLDRRSDVFSLGIVLYELTTGRRLFLGRDEVETLELVRSGDIPKPSCFVPDYPRSLEYIVLKALQRPTDMRYASAEEFRLALDEYLRSQRIVVPSAGVGALLRRVLGERLAERRRNLLVAVRGTGPMPRFSPAALGSAHVPAPRSNWVASAGDEQLLARVRRWATTLLRAPV